MLTSGGLGIINPALIAAEEYSASCHITEPLSQFILDRGTNSAIVKTEQLSRKSAIRNSKSSNYSDRSSSLRTHLDPSLVPRPLFFLFVWGPRKKGSGGSPIHFLCSRIYNFWGSLISGDE